MGESDIRHLQSYSCIREACIVLLEIERVRTRQKAKKSRRRAIITSYLNIFVLTKIFSRAIFGNAKKSTACTVEDTVRILLYKILILRNPYFSFLTKLLPSIFSKAYIRKCYNGTLGNVIIVH